MFGLAPGVPLRTGLSDLFRWWVEELRALVPLRSRWSGRPAIAIFYAADGSVSISMPKASGVLEKTYAASERERAIRALRRRRAGGRPARLVLDEAHCLVRTTTIPAAAQNRAGEILLLELERITPFRRADVCFGWITGEDTGSSVTVVQAIVKRSILAPLIDDLFAAGFERVSVACRLADGEEIDIRLPLELARNDSAANRTARTISRATTAALVIAACAVVWLLFARQADAIARLDSDIAAAQAEAVKVRGSYDTGLASARGILNLRDRKATVPAVTALLEELTRILPDDAWLTELRIDGADVEIVGFAQSASNLTVLLDQSDLFGEVKLVSPVVRSPQDNVERFDIALRTTGGPEPVAAANQQ